MVDAQYRLVKEHLGVRHLRLVLGNSMGGMQTWIWGVKYPDFMDIAVPMASLPTEMSGRNWMMRRLIIDSIRNDPEWMNGNYTKQPLSVRFASVFFGIATNGGNQGLYKAAPTREKADKMLDQRLSAPFLGDANDVLYQWDSSRDYNPSPGLERIQAALLAINSADDERNPPELGLMDREIKRVKNGRVLLIPASDRTAGHGTTAQARFWKQELAELLQTAPRLVKSVSRGREASARIKRLNPGRRSTRSSVGVTCAESPCRWTICRIFVPVSFGYDGESIYLHTAREGKKIDHFRNNQNICFEFERNVQLFSDLDNACKWTFSYESVIGFGKIQELGSLEQKEDRSKQDNVALFGESVGFR